MNLLDENIRDDQAALLKKWKIPFRRVGFDFARIGVADAEIIPLLRRGRRVTFFTHDQDFWKRRLCHPAYALVYLDVSSILAAQHIRLLLRSPLFNTQVKRMGSVIRVQPSCIHVWRYGKNGQQVLPI